MHFRVLAAAAVLAAATTGGSGLISPAAIAKPACTASKTWSTRADNSDLITLKPREDDTYFEFPRQEGLSRPLEGPETLVFYNRFKAPAGVVKITIAFEGDGNNTGFELRLLDADYKQIGSNTGKGKFKHKFSAPSDAQITVRTKASGKSWGSLGHVQICTTR